MNNTKITKIYDIRLLGESEVISGMQKVNKEFEEARKTVIQMKSNLAKNVNLLINPSELEKERQALIKAEKALISETARKKEARAEAEALRAARLEEKNQLIQQEQGNTKITNSYNELLAKIRQLKAEQKNKVDLLNINDADLAKSNEEIRKLQDRINAFNRSLSSEGTNIGEYSRGLVNALKSANLDGIIGGQINEVKQKVKSLDNEFIELQQRLKTSQNIGDQSFKSIEKEIINNRLEAEKLNSQLESINLTMNSVGNIGFHVTNSLKKNFDSLTTSVKNLALGFVGFHAALELTKKMKESAYDLSDQVTNLEIELEKAEGGADGLVNSLSKLDTRTLLTGLTEIANVAAKAGVAEQNMLGVTQAVDKAAVAFGKDFGSIEDGTDTFVKLINIFYEDREITGERILKIGNAIRTLANETVASVPFINDFNGRMAGLKQMFTNFNLSDAIGLGAGFEEFKQSAEVASTALVKVLPKLATDTEKYAKIIGKTKEEFSQLINNNPAEALIQVSEALVKNGVNVEQVSEAFADAELGSGRIATILSTLGGKADVFRERIKRAGEAIQDTTSIEEAFDKKNNNLAATFDKINKKISDLGNNKNFQKMLITTSNLILGLLSLIVSIPFGWWVAGITLLTLAYWDNIKALTVSIAQHAVYITRMAAGNVLIAAGTALQYAQAITVGALNAAYWLLNVTLTTLGMLIPAIRTAWLWLNTAFLGTPVGWVVAGLTAIGGAVYASVVMTEKYSESLKNQGKIIKENTEELRRNEIQRKINQEIDRKAAESTKDSIAKLEVLTRVTKDNANSLETRKKALNQLISISPEYLKGLTLENISTAEGTKILDEYKNKLLEVAKAKAAQQLLEEKQKRVIENEFKASELRPLVSKEQTEKMELNLKSAKEITKGLGYILGIGEGTNGQKLAELEKLIDEDKKSIDVLIDKVVQANKGGTLNSIINFDTKDEDKLKYKPSKLSGIQKDYLKDIDAIRDKLLADNEKAFTKGEIQEKEYLQNILTINKEAWSKKLQYIKGVNAEERKQRAQWENERAKLEKNTQNKLFEIDSAELKKKYDIDKKRIENNLKTITENPYSDNLDKTKAQQIYYSELLELAINFDESMIKLEKKYNKNLVESANERSQKLLGIQKSLNNNSYKLTEEKFNYQKKIIEVSTNEVVNEKNINAELSKQKIILDKNLNSRKKEIELSKIKYTNELEQTEIELQRVQSLIKLYTIKLSTEGLTVDQKKQLNELLVKEAELITEVTNKRKEQEKIGFGNGKIGAPSNANTQNLITKKILEYFDLDPDSYEGMIASAVSQSWDLANTAMNNYFDNERARIEQSKQLAYERIDIEKEQKLAQAQSRAEKESIENQAAEKKKQADKQAALQLKKVKKAEAKIALATEIANIWSAVWQLGPIAGATMGSILTGLASARYLMNINNIESAKFKRGGKLSGPSHANGGIPAIDPVTGIKVAEFEGEEGIINKKSMKDTNTYTVTGTPSQIASRINALGGGVDWISGASMKKWSNGGYLGSKVRPPVLKGYYNDLNSDNYNSERLDRIEEMLESTNMTLALTNRSLNAETQRKVIISSKEMTVIQNESIKQTEIASL